MNISNHVKFSRKMDISFPSLVVEWKYSSFDHRFYTISFKLNFIFILRVIFYFYLDFHPRRDYHISVNETLDADTASDSETMP